MLQFCKKNKILPPYYEIKPDPKKDPEPDPKFLEKSDPEPDPKKIILDPQHCSTHFTSDVNNFYHCQNNMTLGNYTGTCSVKKLKDFTLS